jgi:AraC-like DNA-binding protein
MLACSPAYRPSVIDAGRHHNVRGKRRPFGKAGRYDDWRILAVDDGLCEWTCDGQRHRLGPGVWGLQQPGSEVERLVVSAGCRWAYLRFTAMSGTQVALRAEEVWGISLPPILPAEAVQPLTRVFEDILATWWRSPWQGLRADVRLGSLLVDLVEPFQEDELQGRERQDEFRPADLIWATRPLTPVPELAAACGLSERQFRRRFTQIRKRSPAAFARRLMAAQACDAFRAHPGWSVEQVARHLGYRHAPTFTRAFRAEVGCAPSVWRRE